jgi:acyl carrier protein
MKMSASNEIYGKVTQVLVESLNVDEGDVTPTATLQGDLGAESIDFLDIVFRLEREFGIRIPRAELFPESIFQGEPDFVCEGRVTDRGMSELRSRMPYADLGAFDADRRLSAVSPPALKSSGIRAAEAGGRRRYPSQPFSRHSFKIAICLPDRILTTGFSGSGSGGNLRKRGD